jgi:hypothetical protein
MYIHIIMLRNFAIIAFVGDCTASSFWSPDIVGVAHRLRTDGIVTPNLADRALCLPVSSSQYHGFVQDLPACNPDILLCVP